MRVKVAVTQQHIDRFAAAINNSCGCPIFHALKDAGLEPHSVGPTELVFASGEWMHLSGRHPARTFQERGLKARQRVLGTEELDALIRSIDSPEVAAATKKTLKPFNFFVAV